MSRINPKTDITIDTVSDNDKPSARDDIQTLEDESVADDNNKYITLRPVDMKSELRVSKKNPLEAKSVSQSKFSDTTAFSHTFKTFDAKWLITTPSYSKVDKHRDFR